MTEHLIRTYTGPGQTLLDNTMASGTTGVGCIQTGRNLDRKDLLGHKNGSITSHYSGAELDQLIAAANKVSATDLRAAALTF